MTKKKIILLLLAAALLGLAALWLFLPRPVVKDPEQASILSISIQPHLYYQKDPSDSFVWEPQTQEDQALAREILTYLSQCQESRTLRLGVPEPPLPWKCMYITVLSPQPFSPDPKYRCILLGPSQLDPSPEGQTARKEVDCSFLSWGTLDRFQGTLKDPEAIRTFVLDALDLPEDFM